MNRRGLLGLLTGAVAKGPKLAAGIAEAGARNAITSIPFGGYGYSQVGPAESDWRLSRIAQLRHLLKSGKSDEEKQRERINRMQMLETVERYRLDALRSVSGTSKARMLIESEVSRRERLDRLCAEHELASLLSPVKR